MAGLIEEDDGTLPHIKEEHGMHLDEMRDNAKNPDDIPSQVWRPGNSIRDDSDDVILVQIETGLQNNSLPDASNSSERRDEHDWQIAQPSQEATLDQLRPEKQSNQVTLPTKEILNHENNEASQFHDDKYVDANSEGSIVQQEKHSRTDKREASKTVLVIIEESDTQDKEIKAHIPTHQEDTAKSRQSTMSSRSRRKGRIPKRVLRPRKTGQMVMHNISTRSKVKQNQSKDNEDLLDTSKTKVPSRGKKKKSEQRGKKPDKTAHNHNSALASAEKTADGRRVYACDHCDFEAESRPALKEHKKGHLFKCHICDTIFSLRYTLTVHMRKHTGEHQYPCDICGMKFNTETLLRYHKRRHTGEKPYSCQVCGKMFARSSYLTRHLRVHSGESPYVCPVCGQMFKYTSGFHLHKQQHAGVKKYQCDICGNRFLRDADMKAHRMVHTGEKPHVCKECGKAFRTTSKLSRHMFVHTGIASSMVKCEFCGKNFSQKFNYLEHRRVHTGEKPYVCPVCNKAFATYKSSKRHKQLHIREGLGHLLTKPSKAATTEKELGEISPQRTKQADSGGSLLLHSTPDGSPVQPKEQQASKARLEVAAPSCRQAKNADGKLAETYGPVSSNLKIPQPPSS